MPLFNAHATRIKALLVGHSASGKTVSLSTLLPKQRLYIADLDNKLEVLAPFIEADAHIEYETLNSLDPSSWPKLLALLNKWADLSPEDSTIVVDTLSFAGDLALRHTLKEAGKPLHDVAFSKEFYGIAANKLEQMVGTLVGPTYKPNILLLAHLRQVIDDRTKKASWQPTTIGSALSSDILKWLPEIWALDNNRKLHWKPLPDLPFLKSTQPKIEAETLGDLFERIRAASKEAKDRLR